MVILRKSHSSFGPRGVQPEKVRRGTIITSNTTTAVQIRLDYASVSQQYFGRVRIYVRSRDLTKCLLQEERADLHESPPRCARVAHVPPYVAHWTHPLSLALLLVNEVVGSRHLLSPTHLPPPKSTCPRQNLNKCFKHVS